MTESLKKDWPYKDIVDLPHHVSRRHPQMPPEKRAAQFAPFAALTGYEKAVNDVGRRSETRMTPAHRLVVLTPDHDAEVAALIRKSLKDNHLDIPGTVYFEEGLDHLSARYDMPGRAYYVLLRGEEVVGGIGLSEFSGFPDCCALQKLYLADSEKGHGLGYELVDFIEEKAREMGYRSIYLDTHSNLQAAVHIYEKMGYRRIPRPECIGFSAMDRFFLKEL